MNSWCSKVLPCCKSIWRKKNDRVSKINPCSCGRGLRSGTPVKSRSRHLNAGVKVISVFGSGASHIDCLITHDAPDCLKFQVPAYSMKEGGYWLGLNELGVVISTVKPTTHHPPQPPRPGLKLHWFTSISYGEKIKEDRTEKDALDQLKWIKERLLSGGGGAREDRAYPSSLLYFFISLLPPPPAISWNKKSPIKSVWVRVLCVCVSISVYMQ